jgi:phosphate transport system substrate-binding protein
MRHAQRFVVTAAAALLLVVATSVSTSAVLAQTTSGSDDPARDITKMSGTISGSGSTLANRFYKALFSGLAKPAKNVTIEYRPVGSGRGKTEFGKGLTDFAGTDSTVKDGDGPKAGTFLYVPTTAAAITVAYRLKGVDDLRLSAPTIAKIFQRDIKRWNDPAIVAENPDAKLPDKAIAIVHRADRSGTTSNFTKYLVLAAPGVWRLGSGDTIKWPSTSGQGDGNRGVAQILDNNEGAIGYIDLADAKSFGLSTAAIRNKAGDYVPPTTAGVTAALAGVTAKDDLTYQPLDAEGSASYPITTPTYILVRTAYKDRQTADLVIGFLTHILTKGQDIAARTDYARLPEQLRLEALAQLDKITVTP